MTAPRQVLPGTTYLVTRRCAQRQFLLRPSPVTNDTFLYLLAVAAKRYGVEVHAFCVLSNHYHLVVTDRAGRLPAFQQFLDALVARAVNALLGRWEAFWAPDSYSAVALGSPHDIVDKAAYTLANPVAAGLVKAATMWPGLWSSPEQIGRGLVCARPDRFFDSRGSLPTAVDLTLTAPPGFDSPEDFRRAVTPVLAAREAEAARAVPAFLGAKRVLTLRPWSRPKTAAPRRRMSPRVAALDQGLRIAMLGRLRCFLHAYRAAMRAWRRGDRCARFPSGTYLMRVVHRVACASTG
jgi:putative transposase